MNMTSRLLRAGCACVFHLLAMAWCYAEEPAAAPSAEKPFPKPDATASTPAPLDPAKPLLSQPSLKQNGPALAAAAHLDAARLDHGRSQVRQLFADRFMMSVYRTKAGELRKVTENDPIFDWLARKFAGEDTGEIIFWNSDPPKDFRAGHINATRHWPGFIQISRFAAPNEGLGERLLGFEDLWACAAFELISLGRVKDSQQMEQQVVEKKMSKADFVEAGAKFEYESFLAMSEYYEKVWRPWAQSVGFETEPGYWRLPLPTFVEWRGRYTDHAGYPWKPFESIFDYLLQYGREGRE
jgi:hypothetical protein